MGRQWNSAQIWQAGTATSDRQSAYAAMRSVGLPMIAVGALLIIDGLVSTSFSSLAIGVISVIAAGTMGHDKAA